MNRSMDDGYWEQVCSVLQCVAVCCSVLQCVAVCCSVLQCAAVCCSVLLCAAVCVAVCCSELFEECSCSVFLRVEQVYSSKTHTGREEIWPSGWNAKNQFGKCKVKQTKNTEKFK